MVMKGKDYFLRNNAPTQDQMAITVNNALALGEDIDILDVLVDKAWAQMVKNSGAPNPYYDYFYTGNDVKVYVAEIDDNDPEYGTCPMVAMAFNVTQEKRPVYGFWNYTYSGVMRGNRIVNGQFAVVTKHPHYMRNMLAKAASNRSKNQGHLQDAYPATTNLTGDDANIASYWGKHLDSQYLHGGGNQEFSIHPPFNFVIVYGIQEPDCEKNFGDGFLYTDVNHRLIDSVDKNRPNKIVLYACELTSCARSYNPDGQVLIETYEFFARDCVTPAQ